MQDKKKVAIIGGGCASIAAALELTRPHRAGEFEVTIYQTGWRLGGKGASGRDAETGRIEEHGLHLWMGFYENAFRMMRECYAELDRPEGHPIRTWQDAFVPDNFVGVTEKRGVNQWTNWAAYFPPAAGLPGDPLSDRNPFSVRGYLTRCVLLVRTLCLSVQDNTAEPVPGAGESLTAAVSALVKSLLQSATSDKMAFAARSLKYGQLALGALILEAIKTLQAAIDRVSSKRDEKQAASLLDQLAMVIQHQFDLLIASDPEIRRIWEIVDVVLAIIRGVLRHGLLFAANGFEAIDDYDWRDWLAENGASEASLDSGFIRGSYDLLFAFEDGDIDKPRLAAGQALRGALRMFFTYRGALFWKMQAGMGDIVFTPAYEVLKKRGVRFEFFHKLENVRLSEDKSHVAALEMRVQAKTKKGAEYDPLVDVRGLACWPSRPLYDQLANGAELKKKDWNPEVYGDDRSVDTKTLTVTEDFDFVVLGIGLGAVPETCPELIAANADWLQMTQKVKSVATQAFQVWLNKPVEELGWELPPINISGYVEPFDTWADMRQLIHREDWKTPPEAIAYFCSVLPDAEIGKDETTAGAPELAGQHVRENAVTFLNRDVGYFWPKAADKDGFDWSLLHAQGTQAKGEKRFDSQFWTANINPTERYILSLPGSLKYRISPLETHFDNLTIAGDWTDCGHQAGCVEAAVMSGLLAASALSGAPRPENIIGYDHP
ncbi:NAD(P)-binding protein [Marimonas sp. MJW-29]|uniref:NAD(P)-binding protein n=1 Tax=Sulfitobacter sediminis TaxID=3234186 RepID=A0ABV3RKJ5_9RHOB